MAAVSQFAGDVLLHQGNGFEPQRKANFALVIQNVGDEETLILSLESTSVPQIAMTQGNIKYFNETMRYAGSVVPFEDQTITFRDYIDRPVLQQISAWMKQVWNPTTGAIGWAKDYKKTGDIFLLPPGIANKTAPGAVFSAAYLDRVWHLEGIWPKTFKTDQLDHKDDGASPSLITLTLSVDRCVPAPMQ